MLKKKTKAKEQELKKFEEEKLQEEQQQKVDQLINDLRDSGVSNYYLMLNLQKINETLQKLVEAEEKRNELMQEEYEDETE